MSDPVTRMGSLHDSDSVRDSIAGAADQAKASAAPVIATFKDQASQAAQEAKTTVSGLAGEARARLGEMVEDQKNSGADQVAGLAKAAQSAANDLQKSSPQLARFVQSAAEGVDNVAEQIRSSDVDEVVAMLTDFGRRRPVAFFGAAVAVGFVLARFFKSEPRSTGGMPGGATRAGSI